MASGHAHFSISCYLLTSSALFKKRVRQAILEQKSVLASRYRYVPKPLILPARFPPPPMRLDDGLKVDGTWDVIQTAE